MVRGQQRMGPTGRGRFGRVGRRWRLQMSRRVSCSARGVVLTRSRLVVAHPRRHEGGELRPPAGVGGSAGRPKVSASNDRGKERVQRRGESGHDGQCRDASPALGQDGRDAVLAEVGSAWSRRCPRTSSPALSRCPRPGWHQLPEEGGRSSAGRRCHAYRRGSVPAGRARGVPRSRSGSRRPATSWCCVATDDRDPRHGVETRGGCSGGVDCMIMTLRHNTRGTGGGYDLGAEA